MGSVLLTELCYFAPTSKLTLPAKEVVCWWLATGWFNILSGESFVCRTNEEIIHSGRSAIHRTNSAEGLWKVRILQKAFCHMSNLWRWNSDRAEKLYGKSTGFSWEWALHSLRIGFDMKTFRKSTPTSSRGDRYRGLFQLVPWHEASIHKDTGWHSGAEGNWQYF